MVDQGGAGWSADSGRRDFDGNREGHLRHPRPGAKVLTWLVYLGQVDGDYKVHLILWPSLKALA